MGPNSACLPRLVEEFEKSDLNKQDQIAKFSAPHILLKHVQNGT
jgi:hypothetical protein